MIEFRIRDHLLLPFGGPKWSIDSISVTGISTEGTYFSSPLPLAYIDKGKKRACRLEDLHSFFPHGAIPDGDYSTETSVNAIRHHLKEHCGIATRSERLFLDLYFQYCLDQVKPPSWRSKTGEPAPKPYDTGNWIFAALFPFPQAHLYVGDPLRKKYKFGPDRMCKLDFAFWTGTNLIGIEIDGPSHIGSETHVTRDRMLQRAGVLVVHMLNSELEEYGTDVVEKLLPSVITRFWQDVEHPPLDPLSDIPF